MELNDIRYMMSEHMCGTLMITWEKFNAYREMLEAHFHIEFSMGDKPGSIVRVMPLEMPQG